MFFNKIKSDNSIFEVIFLIIFSVIIFMNIMASSQISELTVWGPINSLVMGISLLVLALSFLMFVKNDKKTIFLGIALAVICILIRQKSDRGKDIIFFIALVFFGIFVNRKRAMKQYLIVAIASICLVVVLRYCGVFYTDFIGRNDENITREFLGFNYTNYAPTYLFYTSVAYFFIKKKHINLLETGVVLSLNLILYTLTDTQAVFWELNAFILFLWILRFFPVFFSNRIFKVVSLLSMPFFTCAIFFLTYTYSQNSVFMITLNKMLTGRLALGQEALERYGLHPFGKSTEWETSIASRSDGTYFYVDSSFISIAISFGIVILIFILVSYMILAVQKHKQGQYMACLAIIFLAIHAFAGERLFEIRFNPTIIYLGSSFIGLRSSNNTGDYIMENNKKNERQISLKTLAYRIFIHWKLILIVSVAIAAAATGYRIFSGYGSLSDNENAQAAQEKYNKNMNEYKKNILTYENTIKTMEATLQSKLDYLATSVLIQIDPNKVSYANKEYYVISSDFSKDSTSKDIDYTANQIIDSYNAYLNYKIDWQSLAVEMEIQPQYLMELVNITPDYNTGRFTVASRHNNEEDALRVLNYVTDFIDKYKDTAKSQFGDFTISAQPPVVNEIVDNSLQNLINNKANDIKNLETSIKQLEQARNKLEPPAVPSALGKFATVKNSITFGVKIFAICLAAMIVFIAIIIVIRRRVLSADELNYTFNFKEIGVFGAKERNSTAQIKYDVVSENVNKYSCGAKNILLVGAAPINNVNKLLSELSMRLKDIKFDYTQKVNADKSSIEKLKAADAVVFVEKIGKSRYSCIEDNYDCIVNWNKNIAGSILY